MALYRGAYYLTANPTPAWLLQDKQEEKQMLLIIFWLCREFMTTSKPPKILIAQLSCCLWKFNFYYDLKDNSTVISRIAVRISKARTMAQIREIVDEVVSLHPGPF